MVFLWVLSHLPCCTSYTAGPLTCGTHMVPHCLSRLLLLPMPAAFFTSATASPAAVLLYCIGFLPRSLHAVLHLQPRASANYTAVLFCLFTFLLHHTGFLCARFRYCTHAATHRHRSMGGWWFWWWNSTSELLLKCRSAACGSFTRNTPATGFTRYHRHTTPLWDRWTRVLRSSPLLLGSRLNSHLLPYTIYLASAYLVWVCWTCLTPPTCHYAMPPLPLPGSVLERYLLRLDRRHRLLLPMPLPSYRYHTGFSTTLPASGIRFCLFLCRLCPLLPSSRHRHRASCCTVHLGCRRFTASSAYLVGCLPAGPAAV